MTSMPVTGHRLSQPKPLYQRVRFGNTSATNPMEQTATGYTRFLEKATCSPWTAKTILEEAKRQGFQDLSAADPQTVKAGDGFFVNNDYQSVALVVMGERSPAQVGFNMVGAHMDSPQLMLREAGERNKGGLQKLATRKHGGLTLPTWFNQPLAIAGRIFETERDGTGKPKQDPETGIPAQNSNFVRTDGPVGIIPIEAIHHNPTLNKSREIKVESDMLPVLGLDGHLTQATLLDSLMDKAGIAPRHAGSAELYFHTASPPQIVGDKQEFIVGQGHDDRAMAYAAMQALFDAAKQGPVKTGMTLFFNDEEVGSESRGGARAFWAGQIAGKVLRLLNPQLSELVPTREEALSKSIILSADVAHAFDPGKPQYHDGYNPITMGHGPAIKIEDGRYATDARGAHLLKLIAERQNIPIQVFTPRQDIPCGTTIGPFMATNTGALTVDVGTPILSMHALQEILAKPDLFYTKQLFEAFFSGK